MSVSLILTVLNEGESIRGVLESLCAQTRLPDELIIADGGSRDNTVAILEEYVTRLPLSIISAPNSNISQGRNAALKATTGDIIAVTDAGVRCEPEWLERLTNPLTTDDGRRMTDSHRPSSIVHRPSIYAVAGFFQSDPANTFELALGATTLPEARDVNPQTFLPSSRSIAFRREVYEKVGGYPEWIDYCEDVLFDLEVRKHFGPFYFEPKAIVHFRPRPTLAKFAKQYFLYARGDGKANLFPKQHAVRYFTYLVLAPLLVYAALTVSPWLWLVGVGAGLAYLRLPLRRVWPQLAALPFAQKILALLYLPIIRLTGDLAKMVGYPAGVWWRVTHAHP